MRAFNIQAGNLPLVASGHGKCFIFFLGCPSTVRRWLPDVMDGLFKIHLWLDINGPKSLFSKSFSMRPQILCFLGICCIFLLLDSFYSTYNKQDVIFPLRLLATAQHHSYVDFASVLYEALFFFALEFSKLDLHLTSFLNVSCCSWPKVNKLFSYNGLINGLAILA